MAGGPVNTHMCPLLTPLFFFVLTVACHEPPPQWRDDAAVAEDKDVRNEKDIKDEDQGEQPDQPDLTDDAEEEDEVFPDADMVVDCVVAEPTANERTALDTLFPEEGTVFCAGVTGSGVGYFIAVRKGETIGYAFPASNYGFDGPVQTLTGMLPDANSIAVAIVQQHESWWGMLGQWFFNQFSDIDITKITLSPKYDENCSYSCTEMYDNFAPYEVDAVSGATYTSNAVTRDVWDAFYLYDELFTPPAK